MSIESLLIWRCAPVLAGIKPANLVSVSLKAYPDAENEILRIAQSNFNSGICFLTVCRCSERILVYVYRENLLCSYLNEANVHDYLNCFGYSNCICLEDKISLLFSRLEKQNDFPHEVGLFLGYPLEDVKGFTKYCGKNAKLCGYWKVYANEEQAKILFDEYEKCFVQCHAMALQGVSLSDACARLCA